MQAWNRSLSALLTQLGQQLFVQSSYWIYVRPIVESLTQDMETTDVLTLQAR